VKSFRFQWPADLAASWAFEMESLILGWYVLTTTGSVRLLVVYGALQWAGSLISPMFGVAGDRLGHRTILCITRAVYVALAGTLTVLMLTGHLVPWHVFGIAALTGLLRPSDMVMRNALIGQTMSAARLLGALAISRTTAESARMVGALAGTGGVALFGMGPAYVIVTALYCTSFCLSFGLAGKATRVAGAAGAVAVSIVATPLRDLRLAFTYVWGKPAILGAVTLAFLVNMLAYPFALGLMPYVAKDVFAVGQTGLGYLAASFAAGGLAGSILLSVSRVPLRAARTMLLCAATWFVLVLALAWTRGLMAGMVLLAITGVVQTFCLMPLAAVMLRASDADYRGRVMGMRMLGVAGLPLGLLIAGPLISAIGFTATVVLFAVSGLALTAAIAWRWHTALWHAAAAANARA